MWLHFFAAVTLIREHTTSYTSVFFSLKELVLNSTTLVQINRWQPCLFCVCTLKFVLMINRVPSTLEAFLLPALNTVATKKPQWRRWCKKEREPRLHLSCAHRVHPSYAMSHISQLAEWLCFGAMPHGNIQFFPRTAWGPCHPFFPPFFSFLFYCFVSRCIVLQGLHVRTGGNRIQANLAWKCSRKNIKIDRLMPTDIVRPVAEERMSNVFQEEKKNPKFSHHYIHYLALNMSWKN